jgi:arabinoxylan arabinofuranohydrolase
LITAITSKCAALILAKVLKNSKQAWLLHRAGGQIEIRLGSIDGELLGVCEVKSTGGLQNWAVQSCKVKKTKGVHDLCFVFKGGDGQLFNFDWWQFK